MLESFEGGVGGQTSSTVLVDTALADKIIEFVEPARVLREICFDYEIKSLAATLPRKHSTGMAVEVAEGSDIPIVRTKMDTVPVALHKNATHFFMTTESEIQDFNGNLYDREAEEAGERMARKEDYDIANVVMAAPQTSISAGTSGVLKTSDISRAKSEIRKRNFIATDILLNPDQVADIEGEATLLNMDYTSEEAKLQGMTQKVIMGLNIIESPQIVSGTAIVLDRKQAPIWFVYHGSTTTETYTTPGVGRGAVVTAFQNPVAMRQEAMIKITGC